MILNLSIKNFAIIEDLDINFKNGMNILLGETGAGKSIIIDALGLLMGNRSDFDKIRNGETKAFVEGTFEIENEDLIKSINEKYSLIEEDHLLVVSRTLENNKSVCRINYHVIPQSILKDIMENIIDIVILIVMAVRSISPFSSSTAFRNRSSSNKTLFIS